MWSLLKDTAASWSNHKAVRLSAAAGLPTPGSRGRPRPTLQFRTHDLPATLWQDARASQPTARLRWLLVVTPGR
jgi:hypothetical protein